MKTNVEKVKEFHETFGHPTGSLEPEKLSKELAFRVKMNFEENCEMAEAADKKATLALECITYLKKLGIFTNIKLDYDKLTLKLLGIEDGMNINLVEVLDASIDIEYFNNGLLVSTGLSSIAAEAFDLVHQNNMTKAHTSAAHAYQTINKLNDALIGQGPEYDAIKYSITCSDGKNWLVKRQDGKLIKPHDHVKVELSTLFK